MSTDLPQLFLPCASPGMAAGDGTHPRQKPHSVLLLHTQAGFCLLTRTGAGAGAHLLDLYVLGWVLCVGMSVGSTPGCRGGHTCTNGRVRAWKAASVSRLEGEALKWRCRANAPAHCSAGVSCMCKRHSTAVSLTMQGDVHGWCTGTGAPHEACAAAACQSVDVPANVPMSLPMCPCAPMCQSAPCQCAHGHADTSGHSARG